MAETWCAKDCEACAQREEMNCPGCKAGPGGKWSGDCEIAKCCNEKGHESCETCSFAAGCSKLLKKGEMPEERRRKRAMEEEKKARVAESAAFLGKWLWILFWLVIPGIIADLAPQLIPNLFLPATILMLLCNAAYGYILLKLTAHSDRYRTAGICCFVTAAVSCLVSLISGGQEEATWTLLITLPAAVVALVGEYHEYMGHSEVLRDADAELSTKWEKLWKWYIGSFGVTIGSIILVLIVPILGLLAMLAGLIGIVVIGIMKLIYLYRTAKLFREYPVTADAT